MKFALSPKKSSPKPAPEPAREDEQISPELVPIVTLLSAQTHRRYHEGIFMLYNDLNGDGNPADREWKEVYGILTGNQLAYWDAVSLAKFKNSPEQLLETSSKPTYLNFTDAVFNAMKVLPAAKQQLENVIIVLTTLKNRFIIQLKSYDLLKEWLVCLRLATYEYSLLQEAYTGALLSARGLRLSDIRTILAEKRFPHSDWVKIRYGSGMAWRRCYAVIEPSQSKKKGFSPGRVMLYDLETAKKKSLVGEISSATSVTAVYPQLPFFIDKSTIMKLEGLINFKLPGKKQSPDSQETALFIMPEAHSSVPGFDTLIRFLVPLFDAFGLYGRPKRLKADRVDPDSLVFGLPTLPHVHYLNLLDLYALTGSDASFGWDAAQWRENIKRVLKLKLAQGYDGCGSSRGFSGAVSSLNSPSIGSPGSSRVSSRQGASPAQKSHQPQFQSQNHSQILLNSLQTGQSYAQNGQHGQNGQYGQIHGQYGQNHGQHVYANGRGNAAGGASNVGHAMGGVGNGGPSAAGNSAGAAGGALGAAAGIGMGSVPRLNPEANMSNETLTFGLKNNQAAGLNKNFNNLQIETPGPQRNSVQLADIYQKYSTIETPSDRFDDRNKLLNGSAEEIDEEHLPSLMRKKSLRNGPYPASDSHLIDSESEEESVGSYTDGEEDLLAVPPTMENRNSSYSSVKSPLTQYNEFSKQFSSAVENHDAGSARSASPPVPPAHEGRYKQGLVPIIQSVLMHSPKHQYSQPHTPSQGTRLEEDYQGIQKSQASKQLNQSLEGKPRYIQAPSSQDKSEPVAPLRVPKNHQNPQNSQYQGHNQGNTNPQSSHQGQYQGQKSQNPGYSQAPQSYSQIPGQKVYPTPQNPPQNYPPQNYQNPQNYPPSQGLAPSQYLKPQSPQYQTQPQYQQYKGQSPYMQAQPNLPRHQQPKYHRGPPPQVQQQYQNPQSQAIQNPQSQSRRQEFNYDKQYQQRPPQQYQRPQNSGNPGHPGNLGPGSSGNPAPGRHPYQARVDPYQKLPQSSQTSMSLQQNLLQSGQPLRNYGDQQYPPNRDPRYQQGYNRH